MAFKFPLATILRVRLLHEEREERLLQKIFQEIAHAYQTVTRIDGEIAEMAEGRKLQVSNAVPARDLQVSAASVTALYECKRELERQLEKLEQLKDTQMEVYRTARQNRETISDLQGKGLSLYNSAVAASEQKMLDDNFNNRRYRG